MLPHGTDYTALRDRFVWPRPARFNIAAAVCDRWAGEPDRPALIYADPAGDVQRFSFADIYRAANRLANVFRAAGVVRGARVGVLLGQEPETAIAHVAAYKVGAVVVPLFTLFGPEALQYRLADSGTRLLVTDRAGYAKIADLRADLPALETVMTIDGPAAGAIDLHAALVQAADTFTTVDTAADDPALIIYTSGTTGPPKGALHAHRVLLGHIPGVQMAYDLLPRPGDVLWTPADWAWIGGLLDVLLPAWYFGLPVLAYRPAKFDPEAALRHMADFGVTTAFLPPTALKMLRTVPHLRDRFNLALRAVGSGGETLGAALLDWGRDMLGVTINEFYGQTECNMVVSSCSALMAPRLGWIGRPVPGHRVAVIDAHGAEVAEGVIGDIAVRRPDPVMFLEYWNNPAATAAKFRGDWLVTGDRGERDALGYVRFVGREDDVITSSGYRIGPGEIEDCLLGHPAVRLAAVVGVPDPERTEIVQAFIVPETGYRPDAALARDIQAFVRTRLAAHEYPRRIVFRDRLPMTATGKIMRGRLRAEAPPDGPSDHGAGGG